MNIILRILIIILQFLAGQLLGFAVAFALGVGDGWELVFIPIGNTVGVWGVGALYERLRRQPSRNEAILSLVGTLAGAFLGVVLILITPALGYAQLLFPLGGALLGYYAARLVKN